MQQLKSTIPLLPMHAICQYNAAGIFTRFQLQICTDSARNIQSKLARL